MRPARPLTTPQAGFMMLELLVSITFATILTAFIAGGLHFGMRAWEASDRAETVHEQELVDHVLASWLAGAMSVSTSADGGRSELEFQGLEDELTFVSLSDGHTQRTGLLSIRLGSSPNGHSGNDVVMETGVFRRGPSVPYPTKTVLARDASLKLAYFGVLQAGSPPAWYPSWKRMSVLPLLIAFRIDTPAGQATAPTIVRLRTGDALL